VQNPAEASARPVVPVWVSFAALSLIWGSSFLFIKIGLDEGLPPFVLVSYRLWIATAFLVLLARVTGATLPRDRGVWARMALLGFFNVALPFCLITWGEQFTTSAIAAIFNALVPLFTIVIASLWLRDEPITLNRIAGLTIGFIGAVLLVSPQLSAAAPGPDAGAAAANARAPIEGTMVIVGELAVALASLSYAASAVFTRHSMTGRKIIPDTRTGPRTATPIEFALPQAVTAAIFATGMALFFGATGPAGPTVPPSLPAWFAVLWLGILGSAVAHALMFGIIRWWGATRATLVTYIFPIVGISLGVLVLSERLHPAEILGTVLIIAGLLLANSKYGHRRLFGRAVSAPPNAEIT
jgi:drug/metabolite transporter (DMT)-like permease